MAEGVVELWLTSEDLGAYGHDIGVTLPELLWQLGDVIPEGAMMRLGMTNPPYILEHLEVGLPALDYSKRSCVILCIALLVKYLKATGHLPYLPPDTGECAPPEP